MEENIIEMNNNQNKEINESLPENIRMVRTEDRTFQIEVPLERYSIQELRDMEILILSKKKETIEGNVPIIKHKIKRIKHKIKRIKEELLLAEDELEMEMKSLELINQEISDIEKIFLPPKAKKYEKREVGDHLDRIIRVYEEELKNFKKMAPNGIKKFDLIQLENGCYFRGQILNRALEGYGEMYNQNLEVVYAGIWEKGLMVPEEGILIPDFETFGNEIDGKEIFELMNDSVFGNRIPPQELEFNFNNEKIEKILNEENLYWRRKEKMMKENVDSERKEIPMWRNNDISEGNSPFDDNKINNPFSTFSPTKNDILHLHSLLKSSGTTGGSGGGLFAGSSKGLFN